MTDTPEKLKPTVRILHVMKLLAANAEEGLRPMQIVRALHVEPSMATRDLQDLEAEGWAERIPGLETHWRLGREAKRALMLHTMGIERAQDRIEEINRNASRDNL